jgi:hypothetical protein
MERTVITATERGQELAACEVEDSRIMRRVLIQTLAGCVACCAVGIALIGIAVNSTDDRVAPVVFWTGLLIGDCGTLWLLLRYAWFREERGV